mmetsp:Transcript_637/g.1402  ORF Transcript_637/g.1402 Transcript_637/m.1402 type:complete len:85 (+) Transcript_637:97-351(+)|eukprot:751917-Hanusia_phi.AAC.6
MVTPLGKEAFDIFFGDLRSRHFDIERSNKSTEKKTEDAGANGVDDLPYPERDFQPQGELMQLMRHWNSFIMSNEKEWLDLANKH